MNSHLTEDQISAWIAGARSREVGFHLLVCPECAAQIDGTQKSLLLFKDEEYLRLGPQPWPARPPRGFAAAWLAAAAVLLVIGSLHYLRHTQQPLRQEVFLEVPYSVPPAPYERTAIVHMDVPVAALIAAGFKMEAPAADSISADVVVGQDGRPLAVGFPENKQ